LLIFKKIRYKNFLSAGNNFLEITLDKDPTTLITGPNGSGKSAGIIDAIYFALYGKAYRKLKKDQIVNAINKKDALVELEFREGSREYMVRRGISPGVFEIYIDGKLKEQDASIKDYQDWLVDTVMKMNATTMKQIVFLGSTSFVPFMRLSTGERRKVVEEVLDIQVFSFMNQILKSRASTLSTIYGDIQSKIKILTTKISLLKSHQQEISQQKDSQIEKNNDQIELMQKEIVKLQGQISKANSEVEILLEYISDESSVRNNHNEMKSIISSIRRNSNSHTQNIKFFTENSDCPTCNQEIQDDFKASAITDAEDKLNKCLIGLEKANGVVESTEARLNEISETQSLIHSLERDSHSHQTRISTIQEHSDSLRLSNENIANENSEDDATNHQDEIDELDLALNKVEKTRLSVAEQGQYFSLISSLLKDNGIKSRIIQNYLPTINSLIRKYLEILEFNCEFTFNESFEETIKSRYRDKFSYANFSEGQKMRIDLALLFSWRELARIRNSASTNLLVLDEIGSSSLDAEGTAAFMRIIKESADESNVFVISHDSSIIDQFNNSIEYRLEDNFSIMSDS